MKKIFGIMATLVLLLGATFQTAHADNRIRIPFTDLPQRAQYFIKTQFGNIGVVDVSRDRFGSSMEVMLSNGIEIDFNKNGEWREIDARSGSSLSEGLVVRILHSNARNYITRNYKGYKITNISKNAKRIEIEVENQWGNDLTLIFDAYGNFLKRED